MIIDENGLEFIDSKYGLLRHCDTISTDIIGDRSIRTILAELHCDDNNIECFYIPFLDVNKEHDNNFGYYISIYKPEYVVEPKIKLTSNEKIDLINLLDSGGWNKLMKSFKDECDSCNSRDCIHKNRILPLNPPNYMLLEE